MRQFAVRLTPDLVQRLRRLAVADARTPSAYARKALVEAIERAERSGND
jgi:predicted transcriptional regulator